MLHLLQASNLSPFDWAYQHMMLIGWPAIVFFAWKISRWVEHLSGQIKQTVGQIDSMATNHFPHMEGSLSKQDVLLTNIDKNIGHLVERL